jgi:hypothetical protein
VKDDTPKPTKKATIVVVEPPTEPAKLKPVPRRPHLGPLLLKILMAMGKSREKALTKLIKWKMYKMA